MTRKQDLIDITFEVAERIAQYLQDANLAEAAYKIRTNAWREGWERDPASIDPRELNCAACARRADSGFDGRCPACANDRARREAGRSK